MKHLTVLIIAVITTNICFSQTTITLQPGSKAGKDAYFKDLTPDFNQGGHPDFSAVAWTNGGTPVISRSIIEFNLSSFPSGAIINGAYLSLYNNSTSPNNSGEHSSVDGPNKSVLRRVTSSWEEFTVTWNNQPSTTSVNEVQLAQSTGVNQDYSNINVTNIVQDMIDNPSASFGFMISLKTEEYYRCKILSSSDHDDPAKHPKLVVTYSLPNSITEVYDYNSSLTLFPNPSSEFVMIEFDHSDNESYTLKIHDSQGRIVRTVRDTERGNVRVDVTDLNMGIYLLQLQKEGVLIGSSKLIVE